MEKEFVSYDISLGLKELGFDEPCFGFYTYKSEIRRYTNFDGELNDFQTIKNSKITMGDNWATSPTYSQAFRWFREKYDLRIWIESNYGVLKFEYVIATTNHNFIDNQFNDLSVYKTYEEAELACLNKLIEIVKNK